MSAKRLTALVLLLTALIFVAENGVLAKTEEPRETTVLGLYAEWQKSGQPEGVDEVFYDDENERLVIVLRTEYAELEEKLLVQVSDPENMELRILPESEELVEESSHWKGVAVLAAAYGGGLLVLAAFLFLRTKAKTKQGDIPTENENWLNKLLGGK